VTDGPARPRRARTRRAAPGAEDARNAEAGQDQYEVLDLPVPDLDEATALRLLTEGELTIVGRLVASTNHALVATVALPADALPAAGRDGTGEAGGGTPLVATCVYKPVAGERPLDDFPDATLGRREVAAYLVSRASGWNIVPPTVLRDGPFGPGMVQRWIDVDPEADPIGMVVGSDPRLRRIAVFDAAVNNTDRKAGHLLPTRSGHVHGVDHGVCFSPVPKLRTVLWNWRGEPFADEEIEVLRAVRAGLDGTLGDDLREFLAPAEITATARRIDRMLEAGTFPQPDPRRPALPWPPV
jgi:hypothetical protein